LLNISNILMCIVISLMFKQNQYILLTLYAKGVGSRRVKYGPVIEFDIIQ